MKIELQDFEHFLVTHDVDLEKVVDIWGSDEGGSYIKHFERRKDKEPTTIRVKMSPAQILMFIVEKIKRGV